MKDDEQQRIFRHWLGQHKGLLFKVVRAFAFTPDDQDDLFQEITFQVWRSIPGYRSDVATTTWMYRVAFYSAMGWARKEKTHRQRSVSLNGSEHLLMQATSPADPRLDWLYEQIGKLDALDRSLSLLLLDGFSYREMADTLGISESNVGVRINRIKKHLVGKLAQGERDEF